MVEEKQTTSFDVIVVGGGVNGCGIARDLALRGISCVLLEKNDFSFGTSWASSGMIHGGPRYMLGDRDVTRLACLDSGAIQKAAPHLLFRIPFIYPVYAHSAGGQLAGRLHLETVEAFFTSYDRFVALKNGKPHTRLSAEDTLALEPGLPADGLLGAVTFDEWGIDVPRLCIANVVDAVEHGAIAFNHTEVVSVIRNDDGSFRGVNTCDVLSGEEKQFYGKVLINATGPWSPQFAKQFGAEIKLRGGKGVHLVFDRRLFNSAIVAQAIDGREMFLLPYENTTIVGTTDDDYFGDLDDQRSTEDEIKYLLDGAAQVFPGINQARMIHSYSGVRPTLHQRRVSEDALSREHELIDHESHDQLKGFVSLIGGKLASYRVMAEETCDLVAKKLGNTKSCQTAVLPLPGGDQTLDPQTLADEFGIDVMSASRLIYRHGSRARIILEKTKGQPALKAIACACEPVLNAEIEYCQQNEFARTLVDLRVRTRWGSGPCQGTGCLLSASDGCSDYKNQERDYLRKWWPNRASVLNGEQLAQEELFQGVHFATNGLK